MYTILVRNGWSFGSLGAYYVVVNPKGETVFRDMHKGRVEAAFFNFAKGV